VHFSTDYVFNGEKTGFYTEEDWIGPLSIYGQSKAMGEHLIEKSGCRFLIFRTSWIYGTHGENFAKKIFKLASEKSCIQVVSDQVGAPTSAELVADIVAQVLPQTLSRNAPLGLYHLAAAGATSWHGYACHLLTWAKHYGMPLKTYSAEEISSSAYCGLAVRPRNSLLDTTKLQATFEVSLPDWRYHVERFVQKLSDIQ
jgi:dTDP-4-dehydrorhamnose reductase